jgi:thiamine transport system permease protein
VSSSFPKRSFQGLSTLLAGRGGAFGTLLWALPLVFLLIFFFYPLGAIFRLAFQSLVREGLDAEMLGAVARPLGFTIYQAVISTLFTMLLGIPAAYVFGRFKFPGKGILRVLTTLPFILPTVVVAASFNALLGPRGWLNLFLVEGMGFAAPPIQILNTLPAIVLAHVFYNTTIIIRTVGSAWEQLDPRVEQAARVLGAPGWRVLSEVTLPLLRPALLSAILLVFLFDFTSFGVILLLGGPRYATLEVEIYIQALSMLNLPMAGLLSAVQLACTLLLTVTSSRLVGGAVMQLAPRVRGEGLRSPESRYERAFVWIVLSALVLLLVSPLGALAFRSVTRFEANRGQRSAVQQGFTLDYYRELFVNRRQSIFYVPPIAAARNSVLYAGATVGLSLTLGFLAAYSLSRRSRANRVFDALLMLPLGASAVTLGLGFIIVFNRPPIDVRSFPLLIPIAHSLVALPFVVRVLQPALVSIPVSLRQAAAVLGASPWQVWREVDLPIVARAALVGAIFSFTISLGEFGATSFLSRPEFPTLPVAIFRFLSQPGALNYGQALAMATLLMLVCGLNILLLERVQLNR